MRTVRERLDRMAASEAKNRASEQAFVDAESYRQGEADQREWMIRHFEDRLHALMARGAHRTHPWITERYENDLSMLYKSYRPVREDIV